MSSLSMLLPNFTLSQSLQVHTGAVRCISLNEDFLLTGSYDSTLFLGKHSGKIYEPVASFSHHSSSVYSCQLTKDNTGFYSGDKAGNIYYTRFESGSALEFAKHSNAVSSLDYIGTNLISGSWDSTAKIWDINTGTCLSTLDNQKHTHAVAVRVTPNFIVTGSQNGFLNFWSTSGNFIRAVKVHDDIIKKIDFNEEIGIITCSNDATVKIISLDGRIVNTFIGHSGFVFSCATLGLDIVSAGDDKIVKVWRDSACVDSIMHPDSVWDVAVNYLGDIITAGGDYFTRVFTLDKDKVASQQELEEYNGKCVGQSEEHKEEIDLSKYPHISELQNRRGKKEGDIEIFRNGNIGEAYMWHVEGGYWERIGEVVGTSLDQQSQGSSRKYYNGDHIFPAGEYEYIFDVDLGEGITKKLPYNNTQNPLETAEKFIAREGMRRDYIPEITKFLNNNAKPNTNPTAPKPQQVKAKYFPQAICVNFTTGNVETVLKKIKEFNMNIDAGLRLDEAELRNLDRIAGTLANVKNYNKSSLTNKDLDLMMKLIRWPKGFSFPCLDLYRFALMHQSTQEIFKTSDHGAEHIAYVCGIIACSQNDNPVLITGYRVLCNMFFGNSSQYAVETRRELVLDSALANVDNTNKNVRLGLISLLFNYSVLLATKNDIQGKIQILVALNEIIQNETDTENLFKALVTIGNIVTGGEIRKEIMNYCQELGLVDTLRTLKCTDNAKMVLSELGALLF